MKRGSIIALIGIVLVLASMMILSALIMVLENSLMEYDWLPIYLEPTQSVSRGFDFSETEVYFYVDYFFRGNPLQMVITDSNDRVILDKTTNNYLLDHPFLAPSGYYVLEITNVGDELVEIYDIGYQSPPLSKDGKGNFLLPSETAYSLGLTYLMFIGIIMAIIGGIIYWKDKRTIPKNQ